jgi:hypothetical protein
MRLATRRMLAFAARHAEPHGEWVGAKHPDGFTLCLRIRRTAAGRPFVEVSDSGEPEDDLGGDDIPATTWTAGTFIRQYGKQTVWDVSYDPPD